MSSPLPPQDHRTGAPVSPGGIDTASMADSNRRRSLGLLGTNALQNALSAFVPPKLAGSGATPPAPAPAPEGLALGAQKPPRPVRRASLVSGVSGDSGHAEVSVEVKRPSRLAAQTASDAGVRATVPPAATNSAQAQVQELLALADGLLPAESPQAQEQQQTSLRDALKESWAGKSYYERLQAIVEPSPAPKRRRATQALADASPLSRAAMAAAALDDDDEDMPRPAPVQAARVPAPAAVPPPAAAPPLATADVHAQRIAALESELRATKQAHQQSLALVSATRQDVSRLTEELGRSKAHASALQAVIQAAVATLASASHP